MSLLGELAGLLTSITWSGSSVLFTMATQQVGSIVVNRIRVLLALIFLILLNWIFYGSPLPFDAGLDHWLWFALSGTIGYALGDLFLFQGFIYLGTQRTMLMMSLAPLMSTGLAWILFKEQLTVVQLIGMILTLAGVSWVILKSKSDTDLHPGRKLQGILFGLGAAIGQAVGYILSKQGLKGGFAPMAGNTIRMLAAVIVLWTLASLQGKVSETFNSMREKPKVFGWLVMAAFTGPVLGATLSLYALQLTKVGVASTLIALPPVFLLPISWLVFKEKFDWGAVLGTLVSITGIALLFLT